VIAAHVKQLLDRLVAALGMVNFLLAAQGFSTDPRAAAQKRIV
jgi:hypothetical protein